MRRTIKQTTAASMRLGLLVLSANEGIALRATLGALDQATRLYDHVTLAQRVAALEAAEQARKQKGKR
jgi:hypothetical protein